MSQNFVLKTNDNIKKIANNIVKFKFEEKEYLIYSISENVETDQIFTSKLVKTSENLYFLDDISLEEKNKLSNIIYNIVILLPMETNKGGSFDNLVENLFNKYGVKLELFDYDLNEQQYHNNSSIAITSNLLVKVAINTYNEKLNIKNIPVWTLPEQNQNNSVDLHISNEKRENLDDIKPNINTGFLNGITPNNPVTNNINNNEPVLKTNSETKMKETNFASNIQQNVAELNDPSLNGLGLNINPVGQAMVNKNSAGFANNKYIIIGTICLILSIVVIVGAFILIKNIK